MKTLKIFIILAMACGMTTSCMDGNWDESQKTAAEAGVGNSSIQETNVITIDSLKTRYKANISKDHRDAGSYAEVTEDLQIKGYVTGNDISGNIYNEIAIDDGTGAIIVSISEGGLYGIFPVGAEVLIDLKGLCVGSYGKQAVIGTPYTNANSVTYVSRMSRALWAQHYKITGNSRIIEPIDFANWAVNDANGLAYAGKLVTLKNVTFKGANGTETYANAGSGAGSKSVYFNEYGTRVMLYTSNYADFAANTLPTGTVNVTGIMKRYNTSWKIIIRTLNDVEYVQ